MEKNSFILYTEYAEKLAFLDDEQMGQLFRAIFAYAKGQAQPDLPPVVALCFSFIKSDLDRAYEKWQKAVERGKKGGRPPLEKKIKKDKPKIKKDTHNLNEDVNEDVNENENENDTVNGDADVDALFERLWAAYPKKVNKAKMRASFLNAKPSESELKDILQAVQKWAKSEEWMREGGRFIPHGHNWLDDRRWLDDAPPPPAPSVAKAKSKFHNYDSDRKYDYDRLLELERERIGRL